MTEFPTKLTRLKLVNGYSIIEKLGDGGMAEVYKAVDLKLEREVAIKFLRINPEEVEISRQRFELEAKALAKLRHPNIVSVLGYGEYEGQPYLVMDYVEGGTLKEKLGKPMPWRKAAALLAPIAKALHYAHGKKIVHRDVKPSNILITEEGQPMLSDFGVAKILESDKTMDLTGTNVGIGTPHYMSPEQGRNQAVSPKSDIYSLGVVLYEMVTGRKPYEADTPFAVLLKHIEDPIPNPSKLARGLPENAETVVLKALSKNPKNRFTDMLEFATAMEQNDSNKGKAARRAKPLPPLFRPRIMVAVLFVALLAVASVWLFNRSSPGIVPAAEPDQRVGERVEIFHQDDQPDTIEFPEWTGFHIAHGWGGLSEEDVAEGRILSEDDRYIELSLDGVLIEYDFIEAGRDYLWWVYNFPEGLTGTHTFTVYYYSRCRVWEEDISNCVDPEAMGHRLTATRTIIFGEKSGSSDENEGTNLLNTDTMAVLHDDFNDVN